MSFHFRKLQAVTVSFFLRKAVLAGRREGRCNLEGWREQSGKEGHYYLHLHLHLPSFFFILKAQATIRYHSLPLGLGALQMLAELLAAMN